MGGIFRSMTEMGRRGARGGPPGAQAPPGCRAGRPPGLLRPPPAPLFGLYLPRYPKTLKREEFCEFSRRSMEETYKEENTSPAGRFRQGEHLPEWEIVAIVITIITSIIEIIINIILTTSTISISSHLTIATYVVTRTIHPFYFTRVYYSFVVNAIKFWWKIIVMTRLFTTYLSPLIMISYMSCE